MTHDFADRQLCPDGNCIGLIGPDGRCKVCGRVVQGWGDERNRGLRHEDDVAPDVEAAAAPVRAEIAREPDGALGSDDFEDRQLCPDGGCIGVIGDDGHCRVCRKAAIVVVDRTS